MLRVFWASDRGTLSSANFYNYLLWGTFLSLLLYLISIFAFNLICLILTAPFFGADYVGISFFELIKNVSSSQINYETLLNGIYKLIFLSFISNILAYLLGTFLKNYISKNNLDFKYDFLRFNSEWYYILTPRQFAFDTNQTSVALTVEVHFLQEIGNSIVIYKGEVKNYQLKDGELDTIVLNKISRTGLTQWETAKSEINLLTKSSQYPKIKFEGTLNKDNNFSFTGDISPVEDVSPIVELGDRLNKINTEPDFYYLGLGTTLIFKASEIKNLHINYKTL